MVGKLSLPEGLKEKIDLLEKLYLILDLSGRAQKKQLLYTVSMGSEKESFPKWRHRLPHRHTAGGKPEGRGHSRRSKKKTVSPG